MENFAYKLILRNGKNKREKCSMTMKQFIKSNVRYTRNDSMVPDTVFFPF